MTTSNLPMSPTTPNTSASPLAQLNDIQLPDPISAMPIAPGYWIIATLIIAIAIWFTYRVYKQYQYHAPRKLALSLLNQYDINDENFATQVNSLLKRTAMTYLPRENLAKLNGQPWFDWLDSRLPSKQQHIIGTLRFKRHQANGLTLDEKQQLAMLAKLWLSNKQSFSDHTLTANHHAQEA